MQHLVREMVALGGRQRDLLLAQQGVDGLKQLLLAGLRRLHTGKLFKVEPLDQLFVHSGTNLLLHIVRHAAGPYARADGYGRRGQAL